jgi:hypothetical protein
MKLFSKKKHESAIFDEWKNFIKTIESMDLDESVIQKNEAVFKELRDGNFYSSDEFNILELFETAIENCKAKNALKIINQYGDVLFKASEHNKKIVNEFFTKIESPEFDKSLLTTRIKYQLMNKYDIKLLPYRKEKIKEAIEFMLKNEKDCDRAEILKGGLLYLDDFIDIDDL